MSLSFVFLSCAVALPLSVVTEETSARKGTYSTYCSEVGQEVNPLCEYIYILATPRLFTKSHLLVETALLGDQTETEKVREERELT